MKVIFRINSLGEEQRIVEETIKKSSWFKEKGYIFVLPKISLEAEYDFKDYQKRISQIEEGWSKIEKSFFEGIEKIFNFKPEKLIEVYFTKYGVGGSYHLPNKIIVNISDEYRAMVDCRTVAHEIIHLFIEPLIQKYKVDHWQKERIVDLIASKILTDYIVQKIPVETKSIDESFNKLFPDIEKIIESI